MMVQRKKIQKKVRGRRIKKPKPYMELSKEMVKHLLGYLPKPGELVMIEGCLMKLESQKS